MPIPGSGAISMSMFNTELGRASNTANSSLAGGTTPITGSLFWLANQSGSLNQTAPHQMSEWYGYGSRTVNLYARVGILPSPSDTAYLYTSFDNITYTYRGDVANSTTCTFVTTFFASGTNLYIKLTHLNGLSEVNINFNATAGTTVCPANAASYCAGTYAAALNTGTNDIAITAYVQKFGGFVEC